AHPCQKIRLNLKAGDTCEGGHDGSFLWTAIGGVLRLAFGAVASACLDGRRRVDVESLGEVVDQLAILDERREQQQAFARLGMLRDLEKRVAQRSVIAPMFGALDQPAIEAVVGGCP